MLRYKIHGYCTTETDGDWLMQLPVKNGIENSLEKRALSYMFYQFFSAETVGFYYGRINRRFPGNELHVFETIRSIFRFSPNEISIYMYCPLCRTGKNYFGILS